MGAYRNVSGVLHQDSDVVGDGDQSEVGGESGNCGSPFGGTAMEETGRGRLRPGRG